MIKKMWPLFLALSFSCAVAESAGAITAAELIEQARAESRELEELKTVMQSPDRNLRLSAFELMMKSDNAVYRELAVEAGLSSTDNLLRSLALKAAAFNMESLYIDLSVDENAPEKAQEKAREALADNVPRMVVKFRTKDRENDAMEIRIKNSSGSAEVQGTNFVFNTGYYAGTLSLKDGAVLQGPVSINDNRYLGTAKLR